MRTLYYVQRVSAPGDCVVVAGAPLLRHFGGLAEIDALRPLVEMCVECFERRARRHREDEHQAVSPIKVPIRAQRKLAVKYKVLKGNNVTLRILFLHLHTYTFAGVHHPDPDVIALNLVHPLVGVLWGPRENS